METQILIAPYYSHISLTKVQLQERTLLWTQKNSLVAHHRRLVWCVDMWHAWLDISTFTYGVREGYTDFNWKCCCIHTQYTCTHKHTNVVGGFCVSCTTLRTMNAIRRAGIFDWQRAPREWNKRCCWRRQTSHTRTVNRRGIFWSYRGSADLIQGFEKPLDDREGETVKERCAHPDA